MSPPPPPMVTGLCPLKEFLVNGWFGHGFTTWDKTIHTSRIPCNLLRRSGLPATFPLRLSHTGPKAKHCIYAGFIIHNVSIVTGGTTVFHVFIRIVISPFPGLKRCLFVFFITGNQGKTGIRNLTTLMVLAFESIRMEPSLVL